jgi:hypothetical protein
MGRPREFDTDAALEKAMRLFWAKSYEGTSVADLTKPWASAGPVCMPHSGTSNLCFAPLWSATQPDLPAMSPRRSDSPPPARWQSNSSGEPRICRQVPATPAAA